MARCRHARTGKGSHAPFRIEAVWIALWAAILGGFPLAAHLGAVIGYGFPLKTGFGAFVQIHGHLQLVGWAGLFIIGISLHFVPRLSSTPITRPGWVPFVLWCLGLGLMLRLVCHSLLPYLIKDPVGVALRVIVAASGVLVWLGVLAYVAMMVRTAFMDVRKVEARREALYAVRPFFAMMLAGFLLYASVNATQLVHMAVAGEVVVGKPWNDLSVRLFMGLVLLPISFAFSVRMFPLYLRLPVVKWNVRWLAYAYLLSVALHVSGFLPGNARPLGSSVPHLGEALRGVIVLWFVWKLDILTRRQSARPNAAKTSVSEVDAFGRFDRHLVAAYAWLALGGFLDLVAGVTSLTGYAIVVRADVLRHIYLLGFVTNLILGMAPRLIPGFVGRRRVAHPGLVTVTFWLANVAAVGRVLYLVLPGWIHSHIGTVARIAQMLFAFSGMLGLVAVICLGINLRLTVRQPVSTGGA